MKLTVIPLFLSCIMAHVSLAENEDYETAIENTLANPSVKNVIDLGGHLRGVARNNSPSEESPYYNKIKETLLAIPGHAQYMADEIQREQKAVENYPTNTGPRVSYDRQRAWYFETLCHLPSPETITVLGHFLYDDIDAPVPLVSPNSDWGENPRANSYVSSGTIMNIGLRNPPIGTQRRNDDPDARLAETRAWWEEIKSGKRTFSFIGQKVEYRFKSDGTWETIALANPPDDAPKPQRAADGTQGKLLKKTLSSQTTNGEQRPWNSWAWIIGAVIALLALVFWDAADAWLKARPNGDN